ncbi:hypothetical protein ONR57_19335 [Hoyosella sp. YIM 151337]|nr:hypothetical protein [Hoyosella sp. YIM 151337]MCW4355460.1 hypothetical protein [Hoyosella sp. YIM 151337]
MNDYPKFLAAPAAPVSDPEPRGDEDAAKAPAAERLHDYTGLFSNAK